MAAAGGFKVGHGHLPTSPFEGVRNSGISASNSSGAAAGGSGGPFTRVVRMSASMDNSNSNSGHQSGNHAEQFRGLASSASQKEQDRSPRGREASFDTLKQQQQLQVTAACCSGWCCSPGK